MKISKAIIGVMTVAVAATMLLSPIETAAVKNNKTTILNLEIKEVKGLNVEKHTIDEIKDFIEKSGAVLTDKVIYSENPLLTAPYLAGSLSDDTQQSALKMLNQIRYIAGIDANVTLDENYSEKAQAGMLVNAVNDKLSHQPQKPEGMSDELYQLGYSGTSSSNIAWNYPTLNVALCCGWLYDGDEANIAAMGHRRWLLNPKMGKTGLGMVGVYSALYSFDNSNPSNYSNVAWPAQTMPIEYFDNLYYGMTYPWTLSTGTVEDAGKVSVNLVRKSDKKQWKFSSDYSDGDFYVNNDGYGQKGCIIFRPRDLEKYYADDIFEVTITGLVQGTVNYEVSFFSLNDDEKADDFVIENGVLKEYVGDGGDVTIPDDVNSIGVSAFENCSNIKSVKISEGVQVINANAFKGCSGLISIEFPDSLQAIANYAFEGCNGLTSIKFPDSVISIGCNSFENCNNLESVKISDKVKQIGVYAFKNCSKLKNVEIPGSVTSIGGGTFEGCSSLETVKILNGIETIVNATFKDCTSLTKIEIPKSVTNIGSYAFWGSTNFIIYGYSGSEAESYASKNNIKFVDVEKNTVSPRPSASASPGTLPSKKPLQSAEPIVSEKPTDTPIGTQKPISLKGDYDNDGNVTLEDTTLALKAALKLLKPNAEEKACADIDEDGNITLDDVKKILQYSLKIITEW